MQILNQRYTLYLFFPVFSENMIKKAPVQELSGVNEKIIFAGGSAFYASEGDAFNDEARENKVHDDQRGDPD